MQLGCLRSGPSSDLGGGIKLKQQLCSCKSYGNSNAKKDYDPMSNNKATAIKLSGGTRSKRSGTLERSDLG